jgi:hypothetical protein
MLRVAASGSWRRLGRRRLTRFPHVARWLTCQRCVAAAALYRIAITQSRYHAGARAYLARKQAEGKSRREAIRCLKRLLVRVVYRTLKESPALT